MEGAVKMWAAEKKDYKQGDEFSAGTGHFSEFRFQGGCTEIDESLLAQVGAFMRHLLLIVLSGRSLEEYPEDWMR